MKQRNDVKDKEGKQGYHCKFKRLNLSLIKVSFKKAVWSPIKRTLLMIKGQVMTQANDDDCISKGTDLPTHKGMSFKVLIIVDKGNLSLVFPKRRCK